MQNGRRLLMTLGLALPVCGLLPGSAAATSPFFGSTRHQLMCDRVYQPPSIIAQLEADAANEELPQPVRDDAAFRAGLIQAHYDAKLATVSDFKTRTCTRLNEVQVLGSHNSYKIKPFH